jgi:hypothetical protein
LAVTRRPHQDLYCACTACKAWDEVAFAKCGCLCGDCKVKFVAELKARGETIPGLEPEAAV